MRLYQRLAATLMMVVWLGFAAAAQAAGPAESVDELLQRAATAIQQQNYHGRFTYEFGNTLETLEVVHVVRDGVEHERISHLNGPPREFLRSGRQQDCVSIGGFLLRGGLISSAGQSVALSQNYHFYIRGRERIAGRDAAVLQMVPKDEYRYGMTLAVDKASGLPLMSLTTLGNQGAIERFQFVHLAVGDEVVDSDLAPVAGHYAQLDGSKTPCAQRDNSVVVTADSQSESSVWRAAWVPPGFVLSQVTAEPSRDLLTYTDGVASFTLFLSPLASPELFKQGVARRGATTALMSVLASPSGYFGVVLVGEVPVATAQQVVASLISVR